MAKQQGWWRLELNIPSEDLSGSDLQHIADLIQDGFTEGEILTDGE